MQRERCRRDPSSHFRARGHVPNSLVLHPARTRSIERASLSACRLSSVPQCLQTLSVRCNPPNHRFRRSFRLRVPAHSWPAIANASRAFLHCFSRTFCDVCEKRTAARPIDAVRAQGWRARRDRLQLGDCFVTEECSCGAIRCGQSANVRDHARAFFGAANCTAKKKRASEANATEVLEVSNERRRRQPEGFRGPTTPRAQEARRTSHRACHIGSTPARTTAVDGH